MVQKWSIRIIYFDGKYDTSLIVAGIDRLCDNNLYDKWCVVDWAAVWLNLLFSGNISDSIAAGPFGQDTSHCAYTQLLRRRFA